MDVYLSTPHPSDDVRCCFLTALPFCFPVRYGFLGALGDGSRLVDQLAQTSLRILQLVHEPGDIVPVGYEASEVSPVHGA